MTVISHSRGKHFIKAFKAFALSGWNPKKTATNLVALFFSIDSLNVRRIRKRSKLFALQALPVQLFPIMWQISRRWFALCFMCSLWVLQTIACWLFLWEYKGSYRNDEKCFWLEIFSREEGKEFVASHS